MNLPDGYIANLQSVRPKVYKIIHFEPLEFFYYPSHFKMNADEFDRLLSKANDIPQKGPEIRSLRPTVTESGRFV